MDWIHFLENQCPLSIAIICMAVVSVTVIRFMSNHSKHLTSAIGKLTEVIYELKEEIIRWKS